MLKNLLVIGNYVPKVDQAGAKSMAQAFIQPLTSLALWAIPLLGLVSMLVVGVKWFMMSEEEREQRPLSASLTKMGKWIIGLMLLPAILKLFGL